MENTKYNGWTNYATWRVNLEFFDGYDTEMIEDLTGVSTSDTEAYALGEILKSQVDDWIEEQSSSDLVQGWARAFTSDVNYTEIAEHLLED